MTLVGGEQLCTPWVPGPFLPYWVHQMRARGDEEARLGHPLSGFFALWCRLHPRPESLLYACDEGLGRTQRGRRGGFESDARQLMSHGRLCQTLSTKDLPDVPGAVINLRVCPAQAPEFSPVMHTPFCFEGLFQKWSPRNNTMGITTAARS